MSGLRKNYLILALATFLLVLPSISLYLGFPILIKLVTLIGVSSIMVLVLIELIYMLLVGVIVYLLGGVRSYLVVVAAIILSGLIIELLPNWSLAADISNLMRNMLVPFMFVTLGFFLSHYGKGRLSGFQNAGV